jgi:RNA 2',3'-cyclic 3'-phosphodiesterase
MKRVFFAVDIVPGPQLLEAFDLIRYRLRLEKVNWVQAGKMHITLAFLGDTEEDLIPALVTAVEKELAPFSKFELTLSSVGVFKSLHDPRVIWTGCHAGPEFHRMKADLDKVLAGYGYEPEGRIFSPHLTLGRIKFIRNPNQLAQLITLYKDVIFQRDVIREVILYESKLNPAGPEYFPLKKFMLHQ